MMKETPWDGDVGRVSGDIYGSVTPPAYAHLVNPNSTHVILHLNGIIGTPPHDNVVHNDILAAKPGGTSNK